MQHTSRPPPLPPPRDPTGINSIVEQHRAIAADDDENMKSDSDPDRRSRYDNVKPEGFFPNKPPPSSSGRRSREPPLNRSTPSPHVYSSPSPNTTRQDSWSDTDELETVRRRPASACGRAPRSHRGSMPPVEYLGTPWGHRSPYTPCCTPLPYHWCGAAQNWTHYIHPGNEVGFDCDDLQQKISQLEVEKHQLTMQVNILSEQVEVQNQKIMELENSLSQSKEHLSNSETLLREEMASRSSSESSKLDLLSQISALRLRLSNVENEKNETQERNARLENELILTCAYLAEKEADLAAIKSKLECSEGFTTNFESNSEFEKLKRALSSVIAANDKKEKKIQEMKTSLNRYKKLHELISSNSSKKGNDYFSKKLPSVEDHCLSVLDSLKSSGYDKMHNTSFDSNLIEKPPPVPRQFQHNLFSSREDFYRGSSCPLFNPVWGDSSSPVSTLHSNRCESSENVNPPTPQKTPPMKRHYSTLPRPQQIDILKPYIKSPTENISSGMKSGRTSQSFHNLHNTSIDGSRSTRTKPASGSSFGKGFFKMRLGKRCSSAPELGAPKKIDNCALSPPNNESSHRRASSPMNGHLTKEKSKGFRKIFSKVKRSGSENLNSSVAELKRGGIRATAGPRLGWPENVKKCNSSKVKFAEWDSDMICDWFLSIGLSMYLPECKKWIKNGRHLFEATTSDFEKELNIKNPLHRKKLLLAVSEIKEQTGDGAGPIGKIDHQWVIRWLDDIGLPQYKDAFYTARIDGRMLHHLTLEDLSQLKVLNSLHHISIKTGIQVLRENKFDPYCLKRRSLPEEANNPADVSKWTNHRVMEWLRTVDLSEYAPNLRGSGVHGGLMLYEPRFNADLMATLLNIPPSKTLLRRHLTTQFKLVVGADIMQKKRECESQLDYLPLSPSTKVKSLKRRPFSLMKRRNRPEFNEEYVCPMNFNDTLQCLPILLTGNQNRTEEEKFLMKEMVLKNETILESLLASNV